MRIPKVGHEAGNSSDNKKPSTVVIPPGNSRTIRIIGGAAGMSLMLALAACGEEGPSALEQLVGSQTPPDANSPAEISDNPVAHVSTPTIVNPASAQSPAVVINPDNVDTDGDLFTPRAGDCDETNPNINPDAVEYCNGIDDDCDGTRDNNITEQSSGALEFRTDSDGDGAPAAEGETIFACERTVNGYARIMSMTENDCDDNDGSRSPGNDNDLYLIPNGVDEDCDGQDDGELFERIEELIPAIIPGRTAVALAITETIDAFLERCAERGCSKIFITDSVALLNDDESLSVYNIARSLFFRTPGLVDRIYDEMITGREGEEGVLVPRLNALSQEVKEEIVSELLPFLISYIGDSTKMLLEEQFLQSNESNFESDYPEGVDDDNDYRGMVSFILRSVFRHHITAGAVQEMTPEQVVTLLTRLQSDLSTQFEIDPGAMPSNPEKN